jgi:hypothetical protein
MRLISFFLIFGIACGMNAQSQPKAYSFDVQLIDLGEITKGEQITGSFSFLNSGNEVLKIELVSSCDCTTVKWPRKGIAPGESGEISFVFDSSKKEVEEDIDIDVYFENIDPNTGAPYFEILQYKYQFKKD